MSHNVSLKCEIFQHSYRSLQSQQSIQMNLAHLRDDFRAFFGNFFGWLFGQFWLVWFYVVGMVWFSFALFGSQKHFVRAEWTFEKSGLWLGHLLIIIHQICDQIVSFCSIWVDDQSIRGSFPLHLAAALLAQSAHHWLTPSICMIITNVFVRLSQLYLLDYHNCICMISKIIFFDYQNCISIWQLLFLQRLPTTC